MKIFGVILCLMTGLCLASAKGVSSLSFKDLDGIERKPLEAGEKLASILIFFWQDCPVSNGYVPELNRIAKAHPDFNFFIVQVDPELTQSAAKEHARKYDLHIPVLLDAKHQLVKFAGAKVTPQVVVIGHNGQILYRGRIDDQYAAIEKRRDRATQRDLIDTLDAINKGVAPKTTETKAIGCLIQ